MYSSTQDFTADETGLLVPKDAPRVKSRRVASAALVALCFAGGLAFSTSAAAPTRGASSLVDQDKSTANPCFDGNCRACGNRDDCIKASDEYGHDCFWYVPLEIQAYCGTPRAGEPQEAAWPLSDLTCSNYGNFFTTNWKRIERIGEDAGKDEKISLNAEEGVHGGVLMICDGKAACGGNAEHTVSAGSAAVPVVVLCCGEDACGGNYQFEVTGVTGVDAHGYCEGEAACKGNTEFEIAAGNTLAMYCAATEDACEDAKFLGPTGSVTCDGDGCSNADEAVDYVSSNCNPNCPTSTENAQCENPFDPTLPVTVIFDSPNLNWCGCATTSSPDPSKQTVGYSGRCSQGAGDYYTKYKDLATQICNRA